ncbi:MBL fold metallo-hydrolase [Manganibacter manganicus]|uniref:MBL fold metallo-hydrolase n=1 Tax=Manganibacter manganicus TaxID=1873176 RepID=A0A1V8RVP7_9HYPH|nr:MBL fold metallo-hydrolase [Pseudaminobacter manganicus]OQM77281.1 MBL fold metallo-hydrolase [Pseudaminobacter manganicus]
MHIDLLGGFGEKGRTSIAVANGGRRLVFDLGIKVGAHGADYYPAIAGPLDGVEAVLISHAHEDHVGALSWLLAKGYRGRILMTAETCEQAPATLADYADAQDLRAFPFPRDRIEIFEPGQSLTFGDIDVTTGRSGHVAGGVWFAIESAGNRLVYSADVVPHSSVFVMDPIPSCDLLLLDASYGADPVSGQARVEAIRSWIAAHAGGCLLPTPLAGRSLELMAAIEGRFAIHAAMRASLDAQIAVGDALLPGVGAELRKRLAAAIDWRNGEPLPDCPLLADDGMGRAGPSARLIPLADEKGLPILLTGHLPSGTPGWVLHEKGRADWIRLPTHPTLSGNVAIWEQAGRPVTLGHSCGLEDLESLAAHISTLRTDCRTGDSVPLPRGEKP